MRYYLSLVAVFAFFNCFAQTKSPISLTGKITDAASGLPLPGANIQFTDARLGGVADTSGRFILRNVPPGHHLVEVSHSGYTTIANHIDINATTEKNFSLTISIVENQGVTVTGVTSATSTRNTPIPTTLVRRTQLMQTPSTNIIDALTRQPGISQISTGPAISKPVIRGLGYNRVVVMNDGTRQEGQQWGDEHGIEIDEASVMRAEVLKGPASIMYGSDALAGVVHFITNVPAQDGTIKGNIYTAYQTNNRQVGLNANLQGAQNGFNWNVYGSTKSAGDFKNVYDGRVLNSRFNEQNYGGYIGLNKSWGFSHLIFSSFNQNVGLVEGSRDSLSGLFLVNAGSPLERIATPEDLSSRKLLLPKQNVHHNKVMSDNNFTIGRSRVKFNVGYQNNIRKEFGNPEDPSETELAFDLRTWTSSLQWRLPEHNHFETTIGMSGMHQQNLNRGEEVIIPEYTSRDGGLFLFTQKSIRDLTLSGGVRYDMRRINSKELMDGVDVKFAPFTKSFSNVSASAGLSFHPTQALTYKLNVARGFRAPALSELASNGAHEGTNRYEYGTRDLKSERSFQLDAGIAVDNEHLGFSLSLFQNAIKDFIFYRRLEGMSGDSILTVGGENLEAFQYDQRGANLAGLEASMDVHPHPLDWLHIKNTVSLIRARFNQAVDGSDNLPMIPAARYLGELRVNLVNGKKAVRNVYTFVELDKTFTQNKPFFGYNTETLTNGYTLLNAGLGGDFYGNGKPFMHIYIAANNLTDVAYQSHLSRLKYADVDNTTGRRGVFNTGRNISIRVHIPFSYTTTKN